MDVYNTLTKRVEAFVPREPGRVSLYICGITPYDALHLGHARTFLVYDVMGRYFEWRGFQVMHVQNVTDVDDKILARARELRVSPTALAARYTQEALEDCDALGIRRPHHYPHVTDHIPDIVSLIEGLLDRGYAYVTPGGSVYFRVEAFPRYGQLSGRNVDDLADAQARLEADPAKASRGDFALWKAAKDGELSWDAPWGRGRPGWHIECSAMAGKYLGSQFDVHGGAIDLLFPHHENTLAQTEAASGVHPAVRHWMHVGMVTLKGRKMAKSGGNVVSVKTGLTLAPPNVWRLLFLSSHYRSPLDLGAQDDGSLVEAVGARLAPARAAWQRLKRFVASTGLIHTLPAEEAGVAQALMRACGETRQRFITAMDHDFGTPAALTEIFSLIGRTNAAVRPRRQGERGTPRAGVSAVGQTVRELLEVLGFALPPSAESRMSAGLEVLL